MYFGYFSNGTFCDSAMSGPVNTTLYVRPAYWDPKNLIATGFVGCYGAYELFTFFDLVVTEVLSLCLQ